MTALRIGRVLLILLVVLFMSAAPHTLREAGTSTRALAAGAGFTHSPVLPGTFTTIDDPHGTEGNYANTVRRVGDSPEIVGEYIDGNGVYHGFLLYTTLDDPKAGSGQGGDGTLVESFNQDGTIVGENDEGGGTVEHGFSLRNGVYTTHDARPGSNSAMVDINPQGAIVGYYDFNEIVHGYVLHKGVYTTLDDPKAFLGPGTGEEFILGTMAFGINAGGDIVGLYVDSHYTYHGFLLHKGLYTTLDDPKAGSGDQHGTIAFGINAQGDIVGFYIDRAGNQRGFLLHRGVYTDVVDPKDSLTIAVRIDDQGDIVGGYGGVGFPDDTDHAFLYTP